MKHGKTLDQLHIENRDFFVCLAQKRDEDRKDISIDISYQPSIGFSPEFLSHLIPAERGL